MNSTSFGSPKKQESGNGQQASFPKQQPAARLIAGRPKEFWDKILAEGPAVRKEAPQKRIVAARLKSAVRRMLVEGMGAYEIGEPHVDASKESAMKLIRSIRRNAEAYCPEDLEYIVHRALESCWNDVRLEAARIELEQMPHSKNLAHAVVIMVENKEIGWEEAIAKYGNQEGFDPAPVQRAILFDVERRGLDPTGEVLSYLKQSGMMDEKGLYRALCHRKKEQLLKNCGMEYATGCGAVALPFIGAIVGAVAFANIFNFYFDWLVGAAAGFAAGLIVPAIVVVSTDSIMAEINSRRYASKKIRQAGESAK